MRPHRVAADFLLGSHLFVGVRPANHFDDLPGHGLCGAYRATGKSLADAVQMGLDAIIGFFERFVKTPTRATGTEYFNVE